ncbi:MAG TPA: 50S ribosomal protein L24 [Nitriliruptoraceae bacterium]|nr:50S ribosomal protein L24 [Nitriliruptoraceae bacterium]
MNRIRKDDEVLVIAGKDAGKKGRVIRMVTDSDRALVEGRNFVTKHVREHQTAQGVNEGGIIQTEAPIHVSNLMPICPQCGQGVRVGYVFETEGDRRSKVRECRKCQAHF